MEALQYNFVQNEPACISPFPNAPLPNHTCSAGVGRSGTFIALDIILDQINAEQAVDIEATVTKMREKRMYMIQTVVSIHTYVYEYILQVQCNLCDCIDLIQGILLYAILILCNSACFSPIFSELV